MILRTIRGVSFFNHHHTGRGIRVDWFSGKRTYCVTLRIQTMPTLGAFLSVNLWNFIWVHTLIQIVLWVQLQTNHP